MDQCNVSELEKRQGSSQEDEESKEKCATNSLTLPLDDRSI